MKRTLLVAALSLAAAGAFAQGTISFNNTSTTLITTNDGITSGAVLSLMSPRVVLYYSTAVTEPAINTSDLLDLTGWTLTSPSTPDVAGFPPGRFFGGTQTATTAAGGSTPWVMVRGWTGGFADWATAYASATTPGSPTLLGYMTYAFQQPTGIPPALPAQIFLKGPGFFNGLELVPVPEPSTFVLAGLGATGLLIFRRRKQV